MKCPVCGNKKKGAVSTGSICGKCTYKFALNPKEAPYIGDGTVRKAIDNLSGSGQYYFTFNQLYSALHKQAEKKARRNKLKSIFALIVITLMISIALGSIIKPVLGIVLAIALLGGVVYYYTRPVEVDIPALMKAIQMYRQLHPIEYLVDGSRFKKELSKPDIKKELFDYSPERILIVEHDDMVDMLIANHFHIDNKAAVISANKYPEHVFKACRTFLESNTQIPVEVIHDASLTGQQLTHRLMSDPSWKLQDKNVKDLGLFVQDLGKMKHPVLMPGSRSFGTASGSVEDRIQAGMRVPADSIAPKVFLGILGVAVIGGMLLLSDELLAAQRDRGSTGGDGGYG
jgi:hypothetical protein